MSPETHAVEIPEARIEPEPRRGCAWVLPLVALAGALLLGWRSWKSSGPAITVRVGDGFGLEPGDPLVYRGIGVGEVQEVELSEDLSEVLLRVRLDERAGALARAGTRFWVVRPQVGLQGVQGLETLLGARHLAVLPGPSDAAFQGEFVALEEPPVVAAEESGGLEVVLSAPRRFGLAAGAPLNYRGITIGTVLAVGLSSDSTRVEVRVLVRGAYVQLVREDSKFWEVGGLELSFELMNGLDIDLDSVRTLLMGGIAMSTPTQPGAPVRTGHRFELFDGPEEKWLEWQPSLPLGSELLPPGAPLPELLRARLDWTEGLLKRSDSRSGWLLAIPSGVIGPADLLTGDSGAKSVALEVRGERLPLGTIPEQVELGVARRELFWPELAPWNAERVRALKPTEDCLIVSDPVVGPRAVSGARLNPTERGFEVDAALSFDEAWHGASVLARADGLLVGILLVHEGRGTIAPVTPFFRD